MSNRVDLYNSTYGNFQKQVLAEVRHETYGKDIGQNSWITTDEYDTFYSWSEDVTGNIELTSERWHASRQRHREDLIEIEGEERFEGSQKFLSIVHKLTRERRLSRFVFLVEK